MKTKLVVLAAALTLVVTVSLTAVSRADTDTQAPTATITATDGLTVGTDTSTSVIITQLADVTDDTGVTKIEYLLNDILIATNSKHAGKDGILLETKDYKNGPYYLTFKLYDAAGNVGLARTMDGKSKLSFYVNNKTVTPAPTPTPTPQAAPACSGKQAAIDRITKRITDRHKQQLDSLDETRDKLISYYDAQDQKLEDFDTLTSDITDKAEAATAAVEDIVSTKVVCDAQAQTALDKFKSANALVMEEVGEYRMALLNLVTELEEL